MKIRKLLKCSLLGVLVLMGTGISRVSAKQEHTHAMITAEQTTNPNNQSNALIKVVRESTERFKDVSAAQAAGYYLQFGCVSGPDSGAMGMHFVNFPLVMDGALDATRPRS